MATSEKPSLTELMQMAQKMQDSMRKAQEDLEKMEVIGEVPGMVKVKMNGRKRIKPKGVEISAEAYKQGAEFIADAVEIAVNKASDEVDRRSTEKLADITKNLGLPPDFKLPNE